MEPALIARPVNNLRTITGDSFCSRLAASCKDYSVLYAQTTADVIALSFLSLFYVGTTTHYLLWLLL